MQPACRFDLLQLKQLCGTCGVTVARARAEAPNWLRPTPDVWEVPRSTGVCKDAWDFGTPAGSRHTRRSPRPPEWRRDGKVLQRIAGHVRYRESQYGSRD